MLWDGHSCLVLNHAVDLSLLDRHRQAGFRSVSINVGMDMNPLSQFMSVIASFRRQIAEHPDKFIQIETIADVDRAVRDDKLAVSFDIEGGVCFGDDPALVDIFARLGVRQIHLAYNRDNALAGGCHGGDIPLSPLGKKFVRAINGAGVLMDMSHTGYRSSLDIMDYSEKPAIFSHANPRGKLTHPRTITKEQAQKCADGGGVIGVTGIAPFLEDLEAKSSSMADHVERLVEWTSIDNVGFGLDFVYGDKKLVEFPADGHFDLWWPREYYSGFFEKLVAKTAGKSPSNSLLDDIKIATPEQIPEVLTILKERGYSDDDCAKIAGGNFYRVAQQTWHP